MIANYEPGASRAFSCCLNLGFVSQHGAELFAEFRRVFLSVGLDSVLNGDVQHLFFVSRNRHVARRLGWEPTAINHFTVLGHYSPPRLRECTSASRELSTLEEFVYIRVIRLPCYEAEDWVPTRTSNHLHTTVRSA